MAWHRSTMARSATMVHGTTARVASSLPTGPGPGLYSPSHVTQVKGGGPDPAGRKGHYFPLLGMDVSVDTVVDVQLLMLVWMLMFRKERMEEGGFVPGRPNG